MKKIKFRGEAYKELPDNVAILPGDLVVVEKPFGGMAIIVITRIAKTFCAGVPTSGNDAREYKFSPVTGLNFGRTPKIMWDTSVYTVYRPLKSP